jgi:hypothetical protein
MDVEIGISRCLTKSEKFGYVFNVVLYLYRMPIQVFLAAQGCWHMFTLHPKRSISRMLDRLASFDAARASRGII